MLRTGRAVAESRPEEPAIPGPASEVPEPQPDNDVVNLAQGMAAVSVNGASDSDPPAPMATASEGTGDISSAFDSVEGVIEDDNAADPNDPAVRWYTVTAGLRVGVPSVAPFVVGIKGACFVRYNTRAEARAAFFDAISRGGFDVEA
ncbi:hypothetical protein HYPSUDRAFT_204742 [Hypholoma sublateritium FD-334 SS-4]|uniref:Uncharacterized protein n=1 Tax=Hypholoma sublateritium (strain FD-334 SS-4) TaxID=945553 RepID=A0A0D2NJV9_HYPSF|nr:hypothetical protein HYPSUDRAFT_204742 [Hypholoma sublateritium FD-334 SS-4]